MRKARNKKFSLLMALVFAFTVIFPAGAAFASDEAKFSSSYNYAKAAKKQNAGTVTVRPDVEELADYDSVADSVYITLTLPEGVEFTNSPKKGDVTNGSDSLVQIKNVAPYGFTSSSSSDVKVWVDGDDWTTDKTAQVKFDFTENAGGNNLLDIAKDFTGNLQVNAEVVGVKGKNIIWSIDDDLTIAKVAEGDLTIKAGSTKKVSAGGDKKVAKIEIEESKSGLLQENAIVTLQIETEDVEFSRGEENSLKVKGEDGISLGELEVNKDDDGDYTEAKVKVTGASSTFPGTITFDPIGLDIAPGVDDDIEISVEITNNGKNNEDETVTVATVGDVTVEVQDLEDNDTVAYAGQKTELDVEFTLATTDGSDFGDSAGDVITFTLNKGEFAVDGVDVDGAGKVKLYEDNEAFYYTCNADDGDELVFDSFEIILDNDTEPGDITLTIEGDFGDLEEVVIATTAKPYTVTAKNPSISTEALGQAAGDITITEADGKALDKDELIKVELPSGVELNGKPKIEVTEGSADAKILKYDDDYFVIEVTKESSSSKPSTFVVSNIKYDTGKLALAGDVELKFFGDSEGSDGVGDFSSDYDDFEDDSLMASVINATVVDGSVVTASYKLGDAGVTIQNGRTLVQVNTLCETLGLQKSWDEANKVAYFIKAGTVVAFPIGQNQIIINGNTLPVDQGGVIIDGATYATLRGIQSAFGGDLEWDDETKTATFKF